MLKFGNKEFRNLQEQVLQNMSDIARMKEGVWVIDEFGIKVIGEADSVEDMPSVEDYKEEHEDWEYGDAYAVGTEPPYELYVLTRANEDHESDYWFNIGEFPMPGPQGETGPEGPQGIQGPQGNTGSAGAPAGFGTITATAQTLTPGSSATATVVASGPDTEKSFAFTFGIPRGQDGQDLQVDWGEIEGTLADQTDLQAALNSKANDLGVVHIAGAETITGTKTFDSDVEVGGSGHYIKVYGTEAMPTIITNGRISKGGGSGTLDIVLGASGRILGNETYGAVMPNTHLWESDKTLATTDDIPTAVSQLTNDSGYITSAALSNYVTTNTVQDITANKTFSGDSSITPFLYFKNGTYGTSSIHGQWGELVLKSGNKSIVMSSTNDAFTYSSNGTNVRNITIPSSSGTLALTSDILATQWGNIIGTLANQTDLMTALNGKQDAIADLNTIRSGAAAGATAVQPADIANMVTTTGDQTISGDKTFSGKLNKNTNGYGVILPSTTTYTQNKTLATTDQIKDVFQHYITFTADSGKTAIATKLLTQGNTPMLASDFAQYLYDAFADSTGGLEATGTIELSSVNHQYVGKLGRGSSNNNITVYPITSTGGYGNAVTLATNIMANFVDIVERVGSHGGGASGGSITGQDVINALGYVPSHVEANPASTTSTLTSIGIDGVNYALQGGGGTVTDVTVNGSSVVSSGVAAINLTPYALTSSLADVATSGSYNDLINKPTIPAAQVNSDWNAVSGVAQILNKPTILGSSTETWTFTLSDGTTTTKTVVLG